MHFKDNFMKKFAVIGNPINHSLSPFIHNYFAKNLKINLTYEKILVDPESFKDKIFQLCKTYDGLNITLPFKQSIVEISDIKSEEAELTGSANTIIINKTTIRAENTDGYGLIADLNDHGFNFQDSKILLVGAGGAANGVIYQILKQKPNSLFLFNRTIEKSRKMRSKWLNENINDVSIEIYNRLFNKEIDLIINATSSSINSDTSPIDLTGFKKQCLCYDMMYGKETPFIKAAKENDLNYTDGIGMLIHQAAESFRIWNQKNVTPELIGEIKKAISDI